MCPFSRTEEASWRNVVQIVFVLPVFVLKKLLCRKVIKLFFFISQKSIPTDKSGAYVDIVFFSLETNTCW